MWYTCTCVYSSYLCVCIFIYQYCNVWIYIWHTCPCIYLFIRQDMNVQVYIYDDRPTCTCIAIYDIFVHMWEQTRFYFYWQLNCRHWCSLVVWTLHQNVPCPWNPVYIYKPVSILSLGFRQFPCSWSLRMGENPVSIFISMWPPLLWCELFIKRRDSICVAFCPLVTLSLQNSLSEYVCRVSVTLFLQNIYNISYGAIGHTVWHKQPRSCRLSSYWQYDWLITGYMQHF